MLDIQVLLSYTDPSLAFEWRVRVATDRRGSSGTVSLLALGAAPRSLAVSVLKVKGSLLLAGALFYWLHL